MLFTKSRERQGWGKNWSLRDLLCLLGLKTHYTQHCPRLKIKQDQLPAESFLNRLPCQSNPTQHTLYSRRTVRCIASTGVRVLKITFFLCKARYSLWQHGGEACPFVQALGGHGNCVGHEARNMHFIFLLMPQSSALYLKEVSPAYLLTYYYPSFGGCSKTQAKFPF